VMDGTLLVILLLVVTIGVSYYVPRQWEDR
jgi:hypothetical protein